MDTRVVPSIIEMASPAMRPVPRSISVPLTGIFLILLFGALYYARAFFLPLILALLIALTCAPLVRALTFRGVPAIVSALMIVGLLAGGLVATAAVLTGPVGEMIDNAPAFASALRQRIGEMRGPLDALKEAGDQVQGIAAPADSGPAPQEVVIAQPGLVPWAAGAVTEAGTTLGATLIFTIFLLASADLFLLKIVRSVPSLSDKKRSVRIVHDIENEVSRYLLTVTAINLGFGCAVAGAMALLGMPQPVMWGVAAALLNYVPYLGAAIGVGLAAAVGLMTFPTLALAAAPPLVYLALHLVESAAVTPLTLGRRLELNTVAILIALALAGWMWSILGALIAVPLLVVIKVFCDHFPSLSTFGEFLSGEPSAADPESA